MTKDIAPELLKEIQYSFHENIKENMTIQDLYEVLHSGKATYNEADRFAVEMGNALAKAFRENVSSGVLPEGKMYYNIASRIVPPELRDSFEEIADYAQAMQKGMNERAKLRIKAQRPKYNKDREKGLIEHICRADRYDNVRKEFEEDIVNFDQSVVTDTLKENAEFQYQSGLSPVIRRVAAGGCCEWCSRLAGTYRYEDVRDTGNDVYRRHRACRCDVTFDPGDGKVQNVHTKQWEAVDGAALEQKNVDNNPELRYNKSPVQGLQTIYKEDVAAGWISPLVSYKKYAECYEEIQQLIGKKTSNGIVITGQSRHLMQRISGTAIDPKIFREEKKKVHRDGVEIEDVIEALLHGRPRPVRNANGRLSQVLVGKACAVTVNPKTGIVIQCNRIGHGR